MKWVSDLRAAGRDQVAPFTGAWIEILFNGPVDGIESFVAPFTGAWIEIGELACIVADRYLVAPFTGAWIEISQ